MIIHRTQKYLFSNYSHSYFCVAGTGYWKVPNSVYKATTLPYYRSTVLPCFTVFYRGATAVLPRYYRGTTSVASRKRQETRPRRPPHGAHAARAPTKQQGHETPHCTARPRSPTVRSKATYTKSDAPIPGAMKLLWEVLRR